MDRIESDEMWRGLLGLVVQRAGCCGLPGLVGRRRAEMMRRSRPTL